MAAALGTLVRELTRFGDEAKQADYKRAREIDIEALRIAHELAQGQAEIDDLKLFMLAMRGAQRNDPEVRDYFEGLQTRYGRRAAGQPVARLINGVNAWSHDLGPATAQIGAIAFVPKPESGKSVLNFRFETAKKAGMFATGIVGSVVLPVVLQHTWTGGGAPEVTASSEVIVAQVLTNGVVDGLESVSSLDRHLKVGYNEILASRDFESLNPDLETTYLERVTMARTAFLGYQPEE